MQGLQVSRRFEKDEKFLNVGNGRPIPVVAIGIVKLVFKSTVVVLSECHFYSSFLLNIISVGLLTKTSYEISIKKRILMSFWMVLLWMDNWIMGLMSQPVNVVYTFKKCPRVEDVSDIFLWHCRLGHIN